MLRSRFIASVILASGLLGVVTAEAQEQIHIDARAQTKPS
jgi:hypothetical protein